MSPKTTILLFACLSLAVVPSAGALLADASEVDPNAAPDLRCESYSAAEVAENGGLMTETFPTAMPGVTVTVHMLCEVLEPVATTLTDCTSTAYSLTGWKWNSVYNPRVATSNSYGFTSSQVVSTFDTSANTWDNAVSANIHGAFTAGGTASQIRKYDGWNQHGWKNLGGGGTIAVTYTWSSGGNALESDAAYNTFYGWSLTGEAGKMDLQNIATHELGHTFGMGHSSSASQNSCLTMYPSGTYGETQKRTLGDGDILGIDALY